MKYLKQIIGQISRFREKHLLARIVINKYFIVTTCFLVWIVFFDNNSFIRWLEVRKTLREQNAQIEFYEREISSTENKINYLKSEKDSLEKFAREEYHYHEDGEDVYLVEYQ